MQQKKDEHNGISHSKYIVAYFPCHLFISSLLPTGINNI